MSGAAPFGVFDRFRIYIDISARQHRRRANRPVRTGCHVGAQAQRVGPPATAHYQRKNWITVRRQAVPAFRAGKSPSTMVAHDTCPAEVTLRAANGLSGELSAQIDAAHSIVYYLPSRLCG